MSIDDPGLRGGIAPNLDDRTGGASVSDEPIAVADLDPPEPADPVAWTFIESETLVVGPAGDELGRVAAMLGSEADDIFHGIAVTAYADGVTRVVPADAVERLTPARVTIGWDAERLAAADRHQPTGG